MRFGNGEHLTVDKCVLSVPERAIRELEARGDMIECVVMAVLGRPPMVRNEEVYVVDAIVKQGQKTKVEQITL